jgi:hypothetical protein
MDVCHFTDIYSLIAAEAAIANVVGMTQMNPPVKDLRKSLSTLVAALSSI